MKTFIMRNITAHFYPFNKFRLLRTTMESFFSWFFDSQSRSSSRIHDSVENFHKISPAVQNYLKQVYVSLCCSLIASAVGAYLHILWSMGGVLTNLATMGCVSLLLATPPHKKAKRVSLLMAYSLLQGASIGPVIKLAIDVDPSILVNSLMGTAIVFACFSGVAMLARRSEYLYLGGLLSSSVSILLWLHFCSSIFGGSVALFQFELYVGLLVCLLATLCLIPRRLLRRLILEIWIM